MENFQNQFNGEIKNLEERIRKEINDEMAYARSEIQFVQETT